MLFIVIAWLTTAPMGDTYEEAEARAFTPYEEQFASAENFDQAYNIVRGNCSMCHAREPVWPGMMWPPRGVVLETETDVARHAQQIVEHSGFSAAMPPPNAVSTMTPENRAILVAWYRDATGSN